jgi:hypothetical protein
MTRITKPIAIQLEPTVECPERRLDEGLRNKYRGRRCFIVGNGPSTLQQDMSLMSGDITIGVNRSPITPTFLCVSDLSVWRSMVAEKGLLESIQETTRLLVASPPCFDPPEWAQFVPQILKGDDWLHVWYQGGFVDPELRGICKGNSVVTALAIPFAFHLGVSEIYLIGCDCGAPSHWYDPEHVNPRPWHPVGFDYILAEHELVGLYAKELGVNIYNATAGGNLDVFPRRSYESLFKRSRSYFHADQAQQREIAMEKHSAASRKATLELGAGSRDGGGASSDSVV